MSDPDDVMFSPSVKAEQTRLGSRAMFEGREWKTEITDDLRQFLGVIAQAPGDPGIGREQVGYIGQGDETQAGQAGHGAFRAMNSRRASYTACKRCVLGRQ